MNIVKAMLLAMLVLALPHAHAQADRYPNGPVRIVVPYPVGGAPDVLSRMLSSYVSQKYGWNLVVENKPGAGGNIALDTVAKSQPDGHLFALTQTDNVALNPLMYSKLSYDPDKDLEPIGLIASGTMVMVAKPGSPFNSIEDVVAFARNNPSKVSFGSPGHATSVHLVHELWQRASNIKIIHVPYRGSAQAVPDLMGGSLDLYMGSIPTLLAQIEGGRLKALGVTDAVRSPSLKDVPTFKESGIDGVEMTSAFGIMAPSGTPKDILMKWNAAINSMLADPDFKKRIVAMGATPLGGSPTRLREVYANDRKRLAGIIRESGIKVD